MTNKPSKKEKTIEKIVQLVCVAITIAGCLLFGSCEQEPCYITTTYSDGSWSQTEVPCEYWYPEDYDLQLTKANTLSGRYLNYETLVDGVPTERDFIAYWEFTPNAIRFQKEEGDNIVTYNQVAISRYEGNTLYTLAGTTEIPYEFTIEDNGSLTITHMSGNYVITYKLSN